MSPSPFWQASPLIPAGCGRWAPADAKIAAHLEEPAVYCKLGLEFIEPQLREGSGEIEAAVKGQLPRLVFQDDLRGGSAHAQHGQRRRQFIG